jgi:hypothetical protein
MNSKVDYLNPNIQTGLPHVQIPLICADDQNLDGFGSLVHDDPESFPVEIVRWPAQGWRPVDSDSGDEGGTTEGCFSSYWRGDVLYGENEAVGGNYVLGYAVAPELAQENHERTAEQILMWHANYHPDGGQLFFPLDKRPFIVPLALPGDDIQPKDFIAFWFDGTSGLYIHPNVWHDGVFTCSGKQRFFDKQGAVHARVSVCFAEEFGCLLKFDVDASKAK